MNTRFAGRAVARPWGRANTLWSSLMGSLLVVLLAAMVSPAQPAAPLLPTAAPAPTAAPPAPPERSIQILVDDFRPQPAQGEPAYLLNRLGGDRGVISSSVVTWGAGQVTTAVAPGSTWAGVWMSLDHPVREGLAVNFSALLPAPITPAYQSRVTGISLQIARGTAGRQLRVELKDGAVLRWQSEITLQGGPQVVTFDLPALGSVGQLVWVLDQAAPGDSVVLERVSLAAATPITDTATAAFVWSYGMLLSSWSPTTGLVRDRASDASGAFDAIQSTGSLAAATAVAEQLGVIAHADAAQIVDKISRALLADTPRFHGLWPHFVNVTPDGAISITPGTEWSSVDTVIAAVGLLSAQGGLGLDTSSTEDMLRAIDWADLATPDGMIAQGYSYTGERLAWAWDVFGGESWLMGLAYAGSTGGVARIAHPAPPTANGAGFIDELAWLFVAPPSGRDYWGNDWDAYRSAAADRQVFYEPTYHPAGCPAQLGLFGLSAGEAPSRSAVPPGSIYQAFGVGGAFSPVNDGADLLGAPVAMPHYAGLIASLRPQAATRMWDWLIAGGLFSPLTNVESLMFPAGADCQADTAVWNHLKGTWNIALQTLGWGRYLSERAGKTPVLWQATATSPLLRRGYALLTPAAPAAPGAIVVPGMTLPIARADHTATSLADGRVLLVGGTKARDVFLADVTIFDPFYNTLAAVAPLHTARHDHSATLLQDGRVLVVGGYTLPQQWLDDAEVYDPAADRWTVIPPLHKHGVGHTATLLRDGRVLVVGGCIGNGVCTDRVEIFDPYTNTWADVAPLPSDRASHAALRLDDGRVLVAGGDSFMGVPSGGDALIYDPQTNAWAATGPMVTPRLNSAIARLPDGRALVVGGMDLPGASAHKVFASAELYDPATDTWAAAAPLAQPRYQFVLAQLPNGQTLAVGGAREDLPQWTWDSFAGEIEQYDPAADRWTTVGTLAHPKAFATAALLPDGRLWVTGGRAGLDGVIYGADTWLIDARLRTYLPMAIR
ncbi:hypothetical protein K2Z83_11055 [Oscillochloris sp. ZM17-4]|uniref:kelch repeat-containing protein n=1 Tax=Oscillochloris sp. ZM17-4 TaxID=2866714 RepID=UPI001C72B57B|nr:kelch repeat-containing protein [Oscillochloris sp. ZM17-4]MBX0328214.1 hypothetical protein [Oscillochloris sp. ZM17-4]